MSKTKTKPSLKEITAENTGVAWLIGLNMADDITMVERFDEKPDAPADPVTWAWGLYESIKDDWPGHLWTVVSNERAKFLSWKKRMALLGIDSTPEEYIAL